MEGTIISLVETSHEYVELFKIGDHGKLKSRTSEVIASVKISHSSLVLFKYGRSCCPYFLAFWSCLVRLQIFVPQKDSKLTDRILYCGYNGEKPSSQAEGTANEMSSELVSCLITGQGYYENVCTAKVMNYTDIHTRRCCA